MSKYLGKTYSCKGETFKVVEEYAAMIQISTHEMMSIEVFEKRVKNGTYKEVKE